MNNCEETALIACDEANATTVNTFRNRSGETRIPGLPANGPLSTPASARPNRTGRILIVEDQNDLSMCMEIFLNGAGHQATVAPTARRAYELLTNQRFDLVLLDVDLPDGNGFDICRWMRSRNATTDVPVVFCTGRDPVETRQRAAELNAGSLFKLFTMDEMLAKAAAALAFAPGGQPPPNQSQP